MTELRHARVPLLALVAVVVGIAVGERLGPAGARGALALTVALGAVAIWRRGSVGIVCVVEPPVVPSTVSSGRPSARLPRRERR